MSQKEAEFDWMKWFLEGFDSGMVQIVLLCISTLSWGFYAGVRHISQLAYQSQMQGVGASVIPGVVEQPAWIETARSLTHVSLAIFAASMLAVIAIEYWDIKRKGPGKGS